MELEVITLTLQIALDADFIGDVFETSMPGNWAFYKDKKLDGNGNWRELTIKPDCRPFEEGDPRNDWKTITRVEIEAAIEKILFEAPAYGNGLLKAAVVGNDASYIDYTIADAIVQTACFGEVVFD